MIVEIVDTAERISHFLDGPVAEIMQNGTITLERANVMLYRHRQHDEPAVCGWAGCSSRCPRCRESRRRPNMKVNEHGRAAASVHRRLGPVRKQAAVRGDRRQGARTGSGRGDGAPRNRGLRGATASFTGLRCSICRPICRSSSRSSTPKNKSSVLAASLEEMVHEGMITMEHVMILLYREDRAGGNLRRD